MKRKLLLLLFAFTLLAGVSAQSVVNLTPWPKAMTTGTGVFTFPQAFTISTENLDDAQGQEVERFARHLGQATGLSVSVATGAADAAVKVVGSSAVADAEGYRLSITASGVTLTASTSAGIFYGLQSILKMLPANVAVGVSRTDAVYTLPVAEITDAPRFAYRGFMLDVSRHFFDVAEVKKLLRLMAAYKMNYFHWHLSDDQGWRVQIDKYPKLTTVGATRSNSYNNSLAYGSYWTNRQYGPFFYTKDDIREVVAYADSLHITIVPEIDMPGHMTAVMTAYPEFSCTPSGNHSVWINGGISADVLNVANPAAVQFCKDVITELCELFPGERFNIGGDECPTSAWEQNAQCQAKYAELGLTSYRQLQSEFISEINEHIVSLGRKASVWNEAITASNANLDKVKQTGAIVYCWNPTAQGAAKAKELGLQCIITPWETNASYYINRKANTLDNGAGTGRNDHLQVVYNYQPVDNGATLGVQGTCWTEHISDADHLEHLILPRLMAVAESGWTPLARKSFDSFLQRMKQDTTMLRLGGYEYHPQFIDYEGAEPSASTGSMVTPENSYGLDAADKRYYRIVTRATDARSGRCWELLRSGASQISTYGSYGAAEGLLWTGDQAAEGTAAYDYQLWAFEENPTSPGTYALVCKAVPGGSLKQTPTAWNNNAYWSYDNAAKHYNFRLGLGGYGSADERTYYYSLSSTENTAQYMNHSMGGKGFRVNCWTNAADGNGGLWTFEPTFELPEATLSLQDLKSESEVLLAHARAYTSETDKAYGAFSKPALDYLRTAIEGTDAILIQAALDSAKSTLCLPQRGDTLLIRNTLPGFEGTALSYNGSGSQLGNTADTWGATAWAVTTAGNPDGLSVPLRLRNVAYTSRYVGAPSATATGNLGNLVGAASTLVQLTYNPAFGDFSISNYATSALPAMTYYPLAADAPSNGLAVAASATAIRPQGTGWMPVAVRVLSYHCVDQSGNLLGDYRYSCPLSELASPLCPSFEGLTLDRVVETAPQAYNLIYTDTPTGVHASVVPAAARRAYDLLGRPSVRPQPGIYIVGGRKVIRK